MEPEIDFDIETCRICKGALIYNIANIGQKGLNKLISVSAIRKDGLFSDNDYTTTNLRLHAKCRKTYTNEKHFATAAKKQDGNFTTVFLETLDAPPMQDLHLIDYENQCLFCAEDASDDLISNEKKKSTQKRVIISKISKKETRESILQSSFVHDDLWSKEVRERIQCVDLVSLNARYHQNCFIKFMCPKRHTNNKRGRPECTQILKQMEQVYKFVESNFNDRQFSIKDITDALLIDLPTERTIRRKLIERYGDKLSVLDFKGKPSIYCFVTALQKVLHDRYMERHSYPETDRENIVRAAANIILEDITLRTDKAKVHPAPTHFWQDIKHAVPDTLDIFLKIVITNNKQDANDYDRKVTALAHTIVSAARPRSFRSPLLLGISSMIHQKYSSKTLIDLLSSLGFCEPHSEINKFGNSTISHPPCQQQTGDSNTDKIERTTVDSIQHVPDNANIRTMIEVVPKEMLEFISCKSKKSSRRNCSDGKSCHKFDDTVPFEEEEVIVKEEENENDMDPLQSLENAPTDNDVKALNKYEDDDRNEEDLENVYSVNFSKKRRM